MDDYHGDRDRTSPARRRGGGSQPATNADQRNQSRPGAATQRHTDPLSLFWHSQVRHVFLSDSYLIGL